MVTKLKLKYPPISDVENTNIGINHWYDLDDAVVTVEDLVGSRDLTENGTVIQATGPGIYNSVEFSTSDDYLEKAAVTPDDYYTAYTWAFHVLFDSFASNANTLAGHFGTAGANNMYFNCVGKSTGFTFELYNQDNSVRRTITSTGALSTSTWYCVIITNGSSEGLRMYIDKVEQGLSDTTTISSIGTADAPFRLGQDTQGETDALHHNGRLQGYGEWAKILNQLEVNYLCDNEDPGIGIYSQQYGIQYS
jgi:hypothetical protein